MLIVYYIFKEKMCLKPSIHTVASSVMIQDHNHNQSRHNGHMYCPIGNRGIMREYLRKIEYASYVGLVK